MRTNKSLQQYTKTDCATVEKVKSFPSYVAHWATLIPVSMFLSQTPAYTSGPRIQD